MSQSQQRPESQPQLSLTQNAGPPSNSIHKGADLIVALIQNEKHWATEEVQRSYAELERRHLELRNQSNYAFEQSGRRKAELEAEVQRLSNEAASFSQAAREASLERAEALQISTQAKNDLVQLAQVLDQFGIIARSGAHDSFNVTLDDRWGSLLREGREEDGSREPKEGGEANTDGLGNLGIVKEEDFGAPLSSQTTPLGFLQDLRSNFEHNRRTIRDLKEEISLLKKEKEVMKVVADETIQEANATVHVRDTAMKELEAELAASREEIERLKLMSLSKPGTTQREVQTISTPTTPKSQPSKISLSNISISRAEKHKEADVQGTTSRLNKEHTSPTLKTGKKLAVKTSSLKRPNKDADGAKTPKRARTSLDSKSTSHSPTISKKALADDESRPKEKSGNNVRRGSNGTHQIFTPRTSSSPEPQPQPQPGSGIGYGDDSQTTETSEKPNKSCSSSTTSPQDAPVALPPKRYPRKSAFVKHRLISNPQSISERSVKLTGISIGKPQASSSSVSRTPTSLSSSSPNSLLSKIKFTKSATGKAPDAMSINVVQNTNSIATFSVEKTQQKSHSSTTGS